MIYTEFIEKIKGIPATFDEYKALDLNDDFINEHIKSFNPKRKVPEKSLVNDDVIMLITNYDVTQTSIGMVNFLSVPYIREDRIVFGTFEVDILAIYHPLGEIRCYESDSNHLMYKCAKNGRAFLSALYEAKCFLEKSMLDVNIYNNELLSEDIADYCAELAGGKQYKNFYMVLFS